MVILFIQTLKQGISDKFTGSRSGKDDIKILCLYNLINKCLKLFLKGSNLCAGFLPGGRLLINFFQCKYG